MNKFFLKISLSAALFLYTGTLVQAQTSTKGKLSTSSKDDRISPPRETSADIGDLKVTIRYSAPGVKERKIWGELVSYGKVWRTGANEATTIEVSRDCKMGGQTLKAGTYALFSIPGETEWTVIFNTVPDQWGAFKYDESKDALRIKVKPTASAEFHERLTFRVVPAGEAAGTISLSWEKLTLSWDVR